MNKSEIKGVFDAGPIIHLDELNCLDLLCDFQEIILTDTVWEEINQHRPLALKNTDLSLIQVPKKRPINEPLLTLCRIFSLDAGEIEALAILEKNPNTIFFTDDASARLVGEQMGFEVHGTIGIIIRSIRRQLMSPEQVVRILTDIPLQTTMHIKSNLLEEVIFKIREEFNF